jgi:ferredoxin
MMLFDEFVAAFGVWEEALSYVHMMVHEEEMQLVVAVQDRAITEQEAAELLGLAPERTAALLQQAYRRYIVDKENMGGIDFYSAGSFYHYLDYFAKHGSWEDIPPQDRRAIDRRFLKEFIARHQANVERKLQGLEAKNALPNDTVLLLHEVEEMIDAATHIVVEPCDCRRLGQNCDRPVETCVWFDDVALSALDRGHSRRLTHKEAKELVRWADRKGLMHTGDSEWQERGLSALCNCCACDCYPFRAAQELDSKGIWPRSRYVAVYDTEQCNQCGACVQRCHFQAFHHDGGTIVVDGKEKQSVQYDPARCWGCGLCANTCPSNAIAMERLTART